MKKETKYQILIITALSLFLLLLLVNIPRIIGLNTGFNPFEETEKETSREDIQEGKIVTDNNIELDNYNQNITIKKGGEYTLTGTFNNTILVDSKEKVTLNLNGVNINSQITSAIANKGTGEIVINIVKGTTNTLKDNGSSEFDGCIYSEGKLTINGEGKLYVYGNQTEGEGIATTDNDITINGGDVYIESSDDGLNAGGDKGGIITINNGNITIKANGDGIDSNGSLIINSGEIYTIGSSRGGDAGIDTDKSFEINGGTVIALGSDMLQNPDKTSKQNYVSFTFNKSYESSDKIKLKKGNEVIIEFTANENFKTLILSNSKLTKGTYQLYVNDEKTNYTFEVK